jgi:hypothetical protein
MKKKMKSVITGCCCAALMAAWGLMPVTASAESLQDVENTWGKPAAIQKLADGAEKRFYRNMNTMDLGFRYFTIKDGNVIANGMVAAAELPSAPVPQANLAEAKVGMSKSYYSGHSTLVADIEQTWGKPVAVKALDSGKEERYYKYQSAMDIGYRTFLVQDGKVIASGYTTLNALPTVQVGKANLAEGKLGISKSYYSGHPTMVADIEQTWGKPVAVKALDNGKEERYYKYQNSMDVGFRTFLIQDGKVVASGVAGTTE